MTTSQTITTSTTPALVPSMDNYLDWNGTDGIGGFTVTAVAWGAAAPSLGAGSVRLARAVLGPVAAPTAAATASAAATGSIPAGSYYPTYTWVGPAGMESGPAPEPGAPVVLGATGGITVPVPTFPPGITEARVYLRAKTDSRQHLAGIITLSGGSVTLPLYNGDAITGDGPPGPTDSSIVGAISDLRPLLSLRSGAVSPNGMRDVGGQVYNVLAFGLVNDGITDNTAALNTLILMLLGLGGGIIFFPAGRYLFLGQIFLPPWPSSAWFAYTYGSIGIRFLGVPTEVSNADMAYGSILDFRWDGTTNNSVLYDFAVVSGFFLQWTPSSPSSLGSIVAAPQQRNAAWIANTTPNDLTVLETSDVPFDPGQFDVSKLGVSGVYTKYYLDVDKNGNIYATQSGYRTDTGITGTESTFVGKTAHGTPAPTLGVRKCTPYPNLTYPDTIRTWAVYLDSSNNIVAVQDLRASPGKIDLKPFATVVFEDLIFTRQFYGRYISKAPYLPGQYILADNASWRCIKPTGTMEDHYPPSDFNNGIPGYWIRDTNFVDLVPFIRTSNTTIHVSRCQFVGPIHGNNLTLPNIDAIHLGGPGGPYQAGGSGDFITSGQEGISSAGQFMGTGSTITGCRFYNIRRGIWARGAGNQWTATGAYFGQGCGDDENGGAIVLEGTAPYIGAGAANILSPIIENTFYVHAIRLGLNASGNTVIGANGLDQWSTTLWTLGGETDTSGSSLPGAPGTPTLKVNAAFGDANLCAWKGQQVLLGGHTLGAVTSAITGYSVTNGGSGYTVGQSLTLTAHHGSLTATVAAVSGGAVTKLTFGAGNTGYSITDPLTPTNPSLTLNVTVTAVGASVPELVTIATTPFNGTTPSVGATQVQSQYDWVILYLDQNLGSVVALIGNGIDNQEIVSLSYNGPSGGYYQYVCEPPLRFIHSPGESVTVAPFTIPLTTTPLYPHGGGDSVSHSLSLHHLVHGCATADAVGDTIDPSAAYNTIVTSGSVCGAEAAAGYQDDTLVTTGTTTSTIITSGHRASPSLLGGSLQVMGAVTTTVVSASSNYAVTPQDSVVLMTVTSKTVTLPPAAVAGRGRIVTVKNAPGVESTMVRTGDGGPIDGNSPPLTVTVVTRFLSDGGAWYTV